MTGHALWIAVALPLLAGLSCLLPRLPDKVARFWLCSVPAPALWAAWMTPLNVPLDMPWLLLGARFELLDVTRIFLVFTSLLWWVAGFYAVRYLAHDHHLKRFAFFWLMSYTGNIGLIVTGDIPSFYTYFALMGFSAYALVIHTAQPSAVRAGRLYLGMTILGEVMILGGLLMIAHAGESLLIREAVPAIADSPYRPLAMGLIIFGFGVKTGLLPLHGWLPLAHPAAPTPASAVLSGSMIKAGLLGWITFLPGGIVSYPVWGSIMIALGVAGAFYAVVIGLTQTHPKSNLAYSSISQMGVMTICIGIGLAEAADWTTAGLIAAVYALNHAFAKGALFLGVGVVQAEPVRPRVHRRIILAGMMLAALAIAGAPMTGGALAKRALKYLAPAAGDVWAPALDVIFPLSALATTLLLTRLLYMLWRSMVDPNRVPDDHPGLMPSWAFTLLGVAFMAWLSIYHLQLPISTAPFSLDDIAKSALPIAAGLIIGIIAWRFLRVPKRPVPAGDVLLPVVWLGNKFTHWWVRWIATPIERWDINSDRWRTRFVPERQAHDRVVQTDTRIRAFEISGAFFVFLMILLMITLLS